MSPTAREQLPSEGRRRAVRTGRRIQSMAALVCGSGGTSRRMGGGGLDVPPLPRYEPLSIECGGLSAQPRQPRTGTDLHVRNVQHVPSRSRRTSTQQRIPPRTLRVALSGEEDFERGHAARRISAVIHRVAHGLTTGTVARSKSAVFRKEQKSATPHRPIHR